MLDGQQKKVKQNLQVKFSQHLGKYKEGVHLPEYNFIQDLCLGILKTISVICNKIAISMNEKVTEYESATSFSYVFPLFTKKIRYRIPGCFPGDYAVQKKCWKHIYMFIYYRLSKLVETCFSLVTRLNIQPHKGKWHDQQQHYLPFMKNGGSEFQGK
ncbi:MAG: hypothetical protein WC327_02585 [Candidatus Cloacimonadia bacterium]|jgi:hypothetical protein